MSEESDRALSAEYAAIHAYGLIGARLSGESVTAARAAEEAHRGRRDDLILARTGHGAPPAAAAAYTPPFAVTDEASALRLAAEVEDGTASAWRAILPVSSGDERAKALDALTDCAVQATRWRRVAGVTPTLVTWPGRPT